MIISANNGIKTVKHKDDFQKQLVEKRTIRNLNENPDVRRLYHKIKNMMKGPESYNKNEKRILPVIETTDKLKMKQPLKEKHFFSKNIKTKKAINRKHRFYESLDDQHPAHKENFHKKTTYDRARSTFYDQI